jgi:hypothetical protein
MTLGVYVYGALALAGMFTMALLSGNRAAALLAIAATGFAYLAQVFGAVGWMKANAGSALACLLLAVAGFVLLI